MTQLVIRFAAAASVALPLAACMAQPIAAQNPPATPGPTSAPTSQSQPATLNAGQTPASSAPAPASPGPAANGTAPAEVVAPK